MKLKHNGLYVLFWGAAVAVSVLTHGPIWALVLAAFSLGVRLHAWLYESERGDVTTDRT